MRYIVLLICLCFSSSILGQEWEFKKEDDGIQAYHQSVDDSKFKRYRITCELEGQLTSMVAILQDINVYTDIFSDLGYAEYVKQNDQIHFELISRTKTPFPAKDRFSYSDSNYSYDKATKTVKIDIECRDNEYLQGYADKGILVTKCDGLWRITDKGNGKLDIVHEFFADPEGIVPSWLVNSRTIDSPIKTLKSIRKLIKTEAYQNRTFSFINE